MTPRTGYSSLQIGLHWLVALLVVAAWWTGEGMGRALDAHLQNSGGFFADNTLHVWLGSAIFVLVLVRLLVRQSQGAPEPVADSRLAQALALWGHRLLYLLMIVVPTFGIATWYFGIEGTGEIHELLAQALMIVALGHALFGIYHGVVKKDGTLRRIVVPAE